MNDLSTNENKHNNPIIEFLKSDSLRTAIVTIGVCYCFTIFTDAKYHRKTAIKVNKLSITSQPVAA